MEPKHSKALEKALEKAIGQVADIDVDEVGDFLECVADIAAHHVMGNIQYGGVDDLDYWESQIYCFEAGLKVAAAMGPDDRVYTAVRGDGNTAGAYTNHMFYFVGKNQRDVAKRLREAGVDWVDSLRKKKGLLPSPL
jgi:hypothetical protein